jgi:hypothetical protein
MKKIFYGMFLFIMLGLLLGTAARPAFAQDNEPTGFQNVSLWLYPEYDNPLSITQPTLLVMLQGQITGATPPVTVRFLVPSTAEMYSAGSMDAQGNYSGGPPDRQASSIPGWDEISYTLSTDTFRMEYYDPIGLGQGDKTISYDFRWLYPIADLTVYVQVPKKAIDFQVTPAGQSFIDSEGYTTYEYNYAALNVGDPPLHFDISYRTGSNALLFIIIGVVAAVGVATGFFLMRRRPRLVGRAVGRRAAGKATARRDSGRRANRFCTRCGHPLEGSPRFCPSCGKKVS